MSLAYIESITSNNAVSTLFTSSAFTSLPLFIPWTKPQPTRKFRLSFQGDSTSCISQMIPYWNLVASITNIQNYTGPSNSANRGSAYNFNSVLLTPDLLSYVNTEIIGTFRT